MITVSGVCALADNTEIMEQSFSDKRQKRIIVTLDIPSIEIVNKTIANQNAISPARGLRIPITVLGKKNLTHLVDTVTNYNITLQRWKSGNRVGWKFILNL